MEKMVTNCSNCPMSTFGGGKHHDMYYCNLDPTFERSTIVYHDDEDDKTPAPDDCPLKDESFVITLKHTEQ